MGNLQLTLGILGVLAIAGIIAHGLWKIRKGNQQQRQQEQRVAEKRQKQNSGFDDDGIGEVRVVRQASSEAPDTTDSVPTDDEDTSTRDPSAEPKPSMREEKLQEKAQEKPSQPLSAAEQMAMDLDVDDEVDTPLPSMRVDKNEEVEQSELALEPSDEKPLKQPEASTEQPEEPEEQGETDIGEPEEVIALHVKGSVQGALLLQMMTELGCKFGDLGIFHRYENTAGTGELIFSVANMFNPGTFDLDNLENFETEGVAFFMALPMKFDGQQAFNMMLNAAKKLATEIPQGQVLDGQRQLLTRQSIHEARQTIREFERQHSA
ncbi:cell division protein [Idiomarina sp. WRN-38]|uniref:cell division protein ZipA n=1 Tax=unclassified Idiomarina TaxID=2614829 RepID=UPI0007338F0F|nr:MULTISPECIES: cell division protein ZipA [unclassified Idiomarina]KTG23327.1 cell division protein [Idiomarina sp. H105]OAE90720.1 cell division protein [Idiomarina sp. WRN-38]WPZ00525.1 cell division protein ZipA [Idiomarina sp. OXR-189]|tara:strand:- start:29683 stop:30645 length:963 start_codon:yes stop_codon:yes gene_type:complete